MFIPSKSEIWKFYRLKNESNVCNYCDISFKSDVSCKIILDHLATHKDDKEVNNFLENHIKSYSTSNLSSGISTISNCSETDKSQEIFDLFMSGLLIKQTSAYTLCESEYFKSFINFFIPGVDVKSAEIFKKTLVPRLIKELSFQNACLLEDHLQEKKYVTLALEFVKRPDNRMYLVKTLSYIHDFKLHSHRVFMQPFQVSESTSDTKTKFGELLIKFPSLNAHTLFAVTSCDYSLKIGMAELAKECVIKANFVCVANRMHLVLTSALTPPCDSTRNDSTFNFKRIIEKMEAVSNIISASPSIRATFSRAIKESGLPFRSLPPRSVTKWNSCCVLLARYLSVSDILDDIPELDDYKLDYTETLKCELLEKLFKHIHNFIDLICLENLPSIHLVIPLINKINVEFEEVKKHPRSNLVNDFLIGFEQAMSKYFPRNAKNNYLFRLGCFLNPFIRHSDFLTEEEINKAITWIEINYDHQGNEQSMAFVSDISLEDMYAVNSKENSKLRGELISYRSLPKYPKEYMIGKKFNEIDILKWWQDHRKVYPLLLKCALDILSIPVTLANSQYVHGPEGRKGKASLLDLENPSNEVNLLAGHLFTRVNDLDANMKGFSGDSENEDVDIELFGYETDIDQVIVTPFQEKKIKTRFRSSLSTVDITSSESTPKKSK